MAQLGTPEKVFYISKDLTSGHENIVAFVRKPNGSYLGPFELTEMTNPNFGGYYEFDFPSQTSDDYGTYVGVIVSPDEMTNGRVHRTPFSIKYEAISVGEIGQITDEVIQLVKDLKQVETNFEVTEEEPIINIEIVES